jgi:hypothetical protein
MKKVTLIGLKKTVNYNVLFNNIPQNPCTGLHPMDMGTVISYHLYSICGSVQDYKIHMDMEVVIFA